MAGEVDPPAEVDVLAQQRQRAVVAAERFPHRAADQRARPTAPPAPRCSAGTTRPARPGPCRSAGGRTRRWTAPPRPRAAGRSSRGTAGRARPPTATPRPRSAARTGSPVPARSRRAATTATRPDRPQRRTACVDGGVHGRAEPRVARQRQHAVDHPIGTWRFGEQLRGAVRRNPCRPRSRAAGAAVWRRSADSAVPSQRSPSWHTSTARTGAVRSRGVAPLVKCRSSVAPTTPSDDQGKPDGRPGGHPWPRHARSDGPRPRVTPRAS